MRGFCVLYSCAAHKLYPLRIRLVNSVTGAIEWHTVAYIPVVRTLKEAAPEQRGRERRCGVLQRVIYLAFRTAIEASNSSVFIDGGVAEEVREFLRILLYLCDQPGEKAVLCLKAGTTALPCSGCRVAAEDAVTPAALTAADRNVLVTLNSHLESAAHRRYGREGKRRLQLEAAHSIHSAVPALAAMAGRGTDPYLLYKMIGFDTLHVRFLFSISSLFCSFLVIAWFRYPLSLALATDTGSSSFLCSAPFRFLVRVCCAGARPRCDPDAHPTAGSNLSVHV